MAMMTSASVLYNFAHPTPTPKILHSSYTLSSRSKPSPTLCETENRDRSTCCFCSHLNCTLLTHIRTHYDVFKTGEGGGGPKECVWAVEHALFLLPSLSLHLLTSISPTTHHLCGFETRSNGDDPQESVFNFTIRQPLAKAGNSFHRQFQNSRPNKENYYNNPRVMFPRWYFAPRRQSWRTWGKWYAKYSHLEFFSWGR